MLVDASTICFLYQVIMPPFASFSPFCSSPAEGILSAKLDTSSPLPHCNLFFSSLLHVAGPPALTRLFDVPIQTAKGVVNIANATEAANGAVSESSNADDPLVGRYVSRAGSGVGLSCDVGRIGVEGSLGDLGKFSVFFAGFTRPFFRSPNHCMLRLFPIGRVLDLPVLPT
jgi:hypothetical protein